MTLLEGIDVSHWQGDITGALAGRNLCVVKVSEAGFVDAAAGAHFGQARRLGFGGADMSKYLGGYHWLDPEPPAESQARVYLRNVPAYVDFHALDIEARMVLPAAMANTQAMARTFYDYIHTHDHRPILEYSSRGTWPGSNGQDGNWVADYVGAPDRLSLLLRFQKRLPWVIWQYGGQTLDRDRFKPDVLAELCGRTTKPPVPVSTGGDVKYIQINAADVKSLPSMRVPEHTAIETFDGDKWTEIGETTVHFVPGLVDGHTDRKALVILTGRFWKDGAKRYVAQVGVIPS